MSNETPVVKSIFNNNKNSNVSNSSISNERNKVELKSNNSTVKRQVVQL